MNYGLDALHPSFYRPFIPHGGHHDEMTALTRRILVYNPISDPKSVACRAAKVVARWLGKKLHWEPYTAQEVIDGYSGALRKRYEAARDSLEINDLCAKDAIVKCFVKRDKVSPEKFSTKAPRLISPRDPRYGLLLGKYTKPIEKVFFAQVDRFGLPFFAKGRNSIDRYRHIKQKYDLFADCVVSTIDASAFDAHVDKYQLLLEKIVYTTGHNIRELFMLLDYQRVNKLRGAYGARANLLARRMSGDMNTSLGNCVIVFIILLSFIDHHHLRRHMTIYDDGDDCLLFTDSIATMKLPLLSGWFGEFGHDLRVENTTKTFTDIVFCQSRPFVSGKNMVRDWVKVICHAFISNKHYNEPKMGIRIMKTIAQAELSLNQGLPIVSVFFSTWLAKLVHVDAVEKRFLEEGLRRRVEDNFMDVRQQEVTENARHDFYDIFGVTTEEQLALESRIRCYIDNYDIDGYERNGWCGSSEIVM